jgi:hypothetical protein
MALCDGPSEDVLDYGTAIQLSGDYYWDDDLSADEEQIICGVYKISTGPLASSYCHPLANILLGQREPTNQGQQTADVSWWPKQSTWEGCGLSVKYWSSDDEVWFQKRLETIRNYSGIGKSPCLTTTQ